MKDELTPLNAQLRSRIGERDNLHSLNQILEQRVAERTKWLTLMHDVTRAISEARNWDEALQLVLRCICQSEGWRIGFLYLPDRDEPDVLVPAISCFEDERFQPFHVVSTNRRFSRGQDLPGRIYADGVPCWVNSQEEMLSILVPARSEVARQVGLRAAVGLPVTLGRDVFAVLELFSDRSYEPSEELANLMNDVSAQISRVLERERLTAQMAELVWREQQDLLHTLHDSLGQTLTGLGFLSAALSQRMTGADTEAIELAEQIAQQARHALDQVRQLSKGLFPIEVDAKSLMPALHQLASMTESLHKIHVVVEGDVPIPVRDARVATQLYRIVQEAVTNAVRHAQTRTIRIQVGVEAGLTRLSVIDDGVGLQKSAPNRNGLGLHIMRYRATSIGAQLSIESPAVGGTTVTCTLRETPRAVDSDTPGR
jgi:signal transduction histidine kinase